MDFGTKKKGDVCWGKEAPCEWSSVYAPPKYVIVHITDATLAQVKHYFQTWRTKFAYTILQENVAGYRIRVEMDPSVVSISGMNKNIKHGIKTYLVERWDSAVVSYEDYEAVVDIPKVGGVLDLAEVKADIMDKFQERFLKRMHYFTESDVDWAIAQGGYVEITKQQALTKIRSKLDD
jgi:hypothetical protein